MGVLTLKIKATILGPMATLARAKPCLMQEQPLRRNVGAGKVRSLCHAEARKGEGGHDPRGNARAR